MTADSERALAKRVTVKGPRSATHRALVPDRVHTPHYLSRHLPYYLTPDEAHQLIDAAENGRGRVHLRLL